MYIVRQCLIEDAVDIARLAEGAPGVAPETRAAGAIEAIECVDKLFDLPLARRGFTTAHQTTPFASLLGG
jgi:hypothetical protein